MDPDNVPDNMPGQMDHGWLGQHQRPYEHAGALALVQMGARPYSPLLGRFLSVDSVEDGSSNDYDYVNGDPINQIDLDGRWAWLAAAAVAVAGIAARAALRPTVSYVARNATTIGGWLYRNGAFGVNSRLFGNPTLPWATRTRADLLNNKNWPVRIGWSVQSLKPLGIKGGMMVLRLSVGKGKAAWHRDFARGPMQVGKHRFMKWW